MLKSADQIYGLHFNAAMCLCLEIIVAESVMEDSGSRVYHRKEPRASAALSEESGREWCKTFADWAVGSGG